MNVRRPYAALATVIAILGLVSAAYAEPNAIMRIKAGKQGEIKGGVTQKGREGSMAIVAFEHRVLTPMDATSGLATGKRQHKPLRITKTIDRASPLLRNALINNETLKEVTIQFFQPSGTGAETNYYTITLGNAHIAEIEHRMLDNRVTENRNLLAVEDISFVYDTITWTFTDGGITATDSFRAGAQ